MHAKTVNEISLPFSFFLLVLTILVQTCVTLQKFESPCLRSHMFVRELQSDLMKYRLNPLYHPKITCKIQNNFSSLHTNSTQKKWNIMYYIHCFNHNLFFLLMMMAGNFTFSAAVSSTVCPNLNFVLIGKYLTGLFSLFVKISRKAFNHVLPVTIFV